MNRVDLDSVLGAVENPVRRRIIAKLSEEPNYQLQLSKELGLSQQLVSKHLISMEGAGLVGAIREDSPRGPQRKEYLLKQSVSITVDLAPNLFRTRVFSFGAMPGTEEGEDMQVMAKVNEILRYPDAASRIGLLARIVGEVDKKLKQMEDRRAVLLYLRNVALREVAKASTSLAVSDRRNVLRYIMKEQRVDIGEMSATLGLQRSTVGDLLEEIEREFATAD